MDITELFPWLFGGGTILLTLGIIICSTIPFLLIFGGIGYWLYSRSQQAKQAHQASLRWRETSGVVVTSRVEVTGGETTSVHPRVVYEYDVHGRRYQSDQIRAGDRFWRTSSSREAYDTIDRYPVGANVVVYYDPANPGNAALER